MAAEDNAAWAPVPALADSPGKPGQKAEDETWFYLCVGHNTWVRINKAEWGSGDYGD